jgi:biotin carboxylase
VIFLQTNKTPIGALEKEGIVFIGPKARALTQMGDKIQSKQLAREAGVNTIPGTLTLPISSPFSSFISHLLTSICHPCDAMMYDMTRQCCCG